MTIPSSVVLLLFFHKGDVVLRVLVKKLCLWFLWCGLKSLYDLFVLGVAGEVKNFQVTSIAFI